MKDLFEQFALVNDRGRTNPKTLPFLQEHDLVGISTGKIQFVRDDDYRVAILGGESAQIHKEIDLRTNVEMQSGFIEQEKQRLLRERAGKDNTLFFTAGNFVHPAVAEVRGIHLCQSIIGNENVVCGFKTKGTSVGVATLQDKFPGARRKQEWAFLLNEGNTLRTGLRGKRMGCKTVKKDAAGKGFKGTGDEFE